MALDILFLLTAVTIATATILPYHSETFIAQFKEFVKRYDKTYENEIEEAFRFGIFLKSLDFIDHLNRHSDNAKFGTTQFSDLTHKEIRIRNMGLSKPNIKMGCKIISDVGDINVNDTGFDWRSKGVVTPVKDQGYCGSCWAFSTIENVESVHAIKTGKLVELSPQQIVDCDYSSFGCNGGWQQTGFSYLKLRGSMSESSYPYVAKTQKCEYNDSKVFVRIKDCYLFNVQEDAFAQKLKEVGPLSIDIDATMLGYYTSGILTQRNCLGFNIDHAVLLVGYGEENGVPYWIVRNSWSDSWGEKGYFRMERNVNCLLVAADPPLTAVM